MESQAFFMRINSFNPPNSPSKAPVSDPCYQQGNRDTEPLESFLDISLLASAGRASTSASKARTWETRASSGPWDSHRPRFKSLLWHFRVLGPRERGSRHLSANLTYKIGKPVFLFPRDVINIQSAGASKQLTKAGFVNKPLEE